MDPGRPNIESAVGSVLVDASTTRSDEFQGTPNEETSGLVKYLKKFRGLKEAFFLLLQSSKIPTLP